MTFWELVAAVALGIALGRGLAAVVAAFTVAALNLALRFKTGWDRAGARAARQMADAAERERRANLAPRKPHECGKLCEGACPEWWKR